MHAARQLPGRGPTDIDNAPASHVNQKSYYAVFCQDFETMGPMAP